jgi:hypothetical protein
MVLLAMQAGFVAVGGLGMWLAPEEGCQRWAALRGIELAAIECPRYVGEHAVLEMYNFSLSKHHAMLGVLFAYFAVYGRSREVINLGFAYFAIAMALDSAPVFTWLSPLVSASFPPIGRSGLVFVAIAALGIYWNSRHPEWSECDLRDTTNR